ncbi:MAG TPA: thermonuclease family protein [Nitrospiraceae bacterium]|nr:thermonuclease family protein [Nitrospiraceae bacterium]
MYSSHAELIRLRRIDCPKQDQAYGHKAKQAVSELLFGKDVTVRIYGLD